MADMVWPSRRNRSTISGSALAESTLTATLAVAAIDGAINLGGPADAEQLLDVEVRKAASEHVAP